MVESMQQLNRINPLQGQSVTPTVSNEKSNVNFASVLKNAIEEVNQTQKVSDTKTEMLAKGKIEDLHDVMLTAQKASVTIEAAVKVQQKVIDSYNEMMRMQV